MEGGRDDRGRWIPDDDDAAADRPSESRACGKRGENKRITTTNGRARAVASPGGGGRSYREINPRPRLFYLFFFSQNLEKIILPVSRIRKPAFFFPPHPLPATTTNNKTPIHVLTVRRREIAQCFVGRLFCFYV